MARQSVQISGRRSFRPEVDMQAETPVICPMNAIFCEKSFRRWNLWSVDVPAEHTIEQVLAPGYFGNVADRVKHMDKIELNPTNLLWWGQVRVLAVEPTLRRVVIRPIGDFEDYAAELPPGGYRWDWGGPVSLWRIFKGKLLVGEHFVTQHAGLAALQDLITARPRVGGDDDGD